MAVFKVAEEEKAAVSGGNFEHYISVNCWLFLKLLM